MMLALWGLESQGLWAFPQPLRGIHTWLIALLFTLTMSSLTVSELIRNYRTDLQRETIWQQRLHAALQLNTLVIDSSPVPIRVFGAQGQCIAVNDAYARLMGQSRETLLTQQLQDNALQSAELTAKSLHSLQTGLPTDQEVAITTADERALWLRAHLVPFEREGQPHLLAHFIDITEHHNVTQELTQLAFHDSLTGLANRRLVWAHFQRIQHLCQRSQQWAAVLVLDLNHFKQLNNAHGHEAGDHMLQEVARRLQLNVRASDVIGRLGGDEFTILLQDVGLYHTQAQKHTQAICDKLAAALAAPYRLGKLTHHASASIGFALLDPSQAPNLDTLLRQADRQMYAHKRRTAGDPSLSRRTEGQ